MRVSLIKRLYSPDGEHWFRKDTTLAVLPVAGVELYVKRKDGVLALPETFEDRVSPEMRMAIVEGSDRIVIYLDAVIVRDDFAHDYGPSNRESVDAWTHWFRCYGFEPIADSLVDPSKLTPWNVPQTRVKAEEPTHASPCCGMESYETGLVGTAFLYTCVGCRQTWHYAGGRKISGTPMQQEPGVRLSDAVAPLDPTAPTLTPPMGVGQSVKWPKLDGGASRGEHPQGLLSIDNEVFGYPDSCFPSTDEESHYDLRR